MSPSTSPVDRAAPRTLCRGHQLFLTMIAALPALTVATKTTGTMRQSLSLLQGYFVVFEIKNGFCKIFGNSILATGGVSQIFRKARLYIATDEYKVLQF